MALNGLICADVPLSNYSFTHSTNLAIRSNLSVDKSKCSKSKCTLIYTLTLLTDALDLFRHVRTPRDVQSLSLDLSLLIICAIELLTFSKFILFTRFISSSEKRDNRGIILILASTLSEEQMLNFIYI